MNSSTIRQQFVEHLSVIFRRFLLVRHKRTQFYSRVFGEVDVEIIYLKSVLESLFHAGFEQFSKVGTFRNNSEKPGIEILEFIVVA